MKTRFRRLVASLAVAAAVLVGMVTPVSTAAATSVPFTCGGWKAMGKVALRVCLEVTPTTARPVMQINNTASSVRVIIGGWAIQQGCAGGVVSGSTRWGAPHGYSSTGLARPCVRSDRVDLFLAMGWNYEGAGVSPGGNPNAYASVVWHY